MKWKKEHRTVKTTASSVVSAAQSSSAPTSLEDKEDEKQTGTGNEHSSGEEQSL